MLLKVIDFIEGNINMLGDHFDMLPAYKKEQVLYRASICKDTCVKEKKCKECGCSIPGRLYTSKSCNKGELFPNLMKLSLWEEYKKEHNIIIDEKVFDN